MAEQDWTDQRGAHPVALNLKHYGNTVCLSLRGPSMNGGLTPGPSVSAEMPLEEFKTTIIQFIKSIRDGS